MIACGQSFSADDVCIACRIRKSPTIANPQWDEMSPAVCTLRRWNDRKEGPELIFQMIQIEKMGSFSSSSGRKLRSNSSLDRRRVSADVKSNSAKTPPLKIPCADILLMEGDDQLFITLANGNQMELTFDSRNSRDVLCAFLAAAVPQERITIASINNNHAMDSCGTGMSFDVEMLTANRMRERLDSESWTEKLRRKLMHVSSRITEEMVCAPCWYDKTPSNQSNQFKEKTGFILPPGLEASPGKRPDLEKCQIPSGMSMEPSVVDGD